MKFIQTGWPAILWAIFIFILSVIPGKQFPRELFIPHLDKAVHLTFYLVLFVLGYGAKKNELSILALSTVCFLYGLLIELIQHYLIPNRFFGADDILANTIGIVFGVLFVKRIIKF